MHKAVPLAVIACLVLAACSKPAPPPSAPAAAPGDMPGASADQAALVKAISADEGDFCTRFQQTPGFDNWAVTVADYRYSDSNPNIDVTFDAGDGVKLEQNIHGDNPLHDAVAALHQGDTAHISGRFIHGNGECSYKLDVVGIALTAVK